MKKSIIAAGAASVALAAMPIVGAFATPVEEVVTDNITVNLNSTCSMTRTGASGTAATGVVAGTWTAGDPEATSSGSYSVQMDAGALADMGTSTIVVTCNDTNAGHYLKVTATGLNGADTATTGESIAYSNSAAVAGTEAWNIVLGRPNGTTIPAWNSGAVSDAGIVAVTQTSGVGSADLYGSSASTNKTVLSNATFTANYKVSTALTTKAGEYSGSAVYTLTHGE